MCNCIFITYYSFQIIYKEKPIYQQPTSEILDKSEKIVKILRKKLNIHDHIADLIHECDEMKEQKKAMEYQLEQLGISVGKIREGGAIPQREYVRTEQREKQDRNSRNRKSKKLKD